MRYHLGGFCQVKIITKIREKLVLVGPYPPTPLSNFLLFFETFWNMKTTQKTQKNTKFLKKKNPSWGLTHQPTSEFFLDFLNYFNLTKPLGVVIILANITFQKGWIHWHAKKWDMLQTLFFNSQISLTSSVLWFFILEQQTKYLKRFAVQNDI